jgi:DNA polymerase I-like protein with 3'-5' exonuclease and polymerase domains
MYPNLAAWQKEIVDVTNARGYSESTYFKLRRYYADDTYTHAMNFPIQSSAWEILACAMLYVHERLPADGTIQISHHVYDELCLVATEQRKEEAALLLRDGFRHGYNRVFPGASTKGLVGIGSGISWFEAASDDVINPEWSL